MFANAVFTATPQEATLHITGMDCAWSSPGPSVLLGHVSEGEHRLQRARRWLCQGHWSVKCQLWVLHAGEAKTASQGDHTLASKGFWEPIWRRKESATIKYRGWVCRFPRRRAGSQSGRDRGIDLGSGRCVPTVRRAWGWEGSLRW